MSGLFKSKTEDRTTTVDPWAVLPPSIKDDIIKQSGMTTDMLEQAFKVATETGQDPREILGMNETEYGAYDRIIQGGLDEQDLTDRSTDGLLTGRENYEDPYTDAVVDTTLAGMDRNADREQLQRDMRAASVGGTSNTRAAVGDAVADSLYGMDRAQTEAGLRSDAFRFGTDADFKARDMTDQFASSGLIRDAALADWQKGFGQEERVLEQEQLDATRNSQQDQLSWLASILGKGPNTALGGGVTTGQVEKPSTFSQLLGGASAIGGLSGMFGISDEDAKENFTPVDSALDDIRGMRVEEYDYKEGVPTDRTGRQRGLIAQDLENIPGAVTTGEDGYRRVDAYPVLATIVKAVKDLDDRTRPNQAGLN